MPTINAKINLTALRSKGVGPIVRMLSLASFALNAATTAEEADPPLEGILVQLKLQEPLSIEETRAAHRSWLTGTVVRQYIQEYSGFLEECALVATLIRKRNDAESELDTAKQRKVLNAMNFPGKLNYVEHHARISLNEVLKEQVLSVNRARNCYEHRRGIVGDRDIDKGDTLEIQWTHLRLLRSSASGDQEVVSLPALFEKGDTLSMDRVAGGKGFKSGDHLEFSTADIVDMGATLVLQVLEIVAQIGNRINRT